MSNITLYVRINPRKQSPVFYRAGFKFTKEWQEVVVDNATASCLYGEQALEVVDTLPVEPTEPTEPLGDGTELQDEALRQAQGERVEAVEQPVDSVHGEPVDTVRGEPVDTVRGEPVDTVRGEPVDTVRGEPVEPPVDAVAVDAAVVVEPLPEVLNDDLGYGAPSVAVVDDNGKKKGKS